IYFRKDLLSLAKNLPKYSPKKHTKLNNLTTFLILSTILTGAIGYSLTKTVLQNPPSPMYSTIFIGALLIITGFLQRNHSLYSNATKNNPDLNDSIFVGILQGFSALPGMSRSGVTLIALLRTGFSLKDAFRLSFLMSIPVIAGAQIGMGFMNLLNIDPFIAITGAIMSFIFGLISIKYLMDIAGKARFDIFCLILGSFTIIYAFVIYL
ncbi:MAG: undecaprenyl-diphosphate phosphatase, partial [Candidatus Aenigmarchaeota archaeon]|nr:undecaprenyl-diphosphate phosphatase [Candidatus Aenigmarchaeota archaeon]